MEEKKSKKIFGEICAFIILILIIGGISYGAYYWYGHIYKINNKDNGTSKIKNGDYKAYTYTAKDGHYVRVINDKYVVEMADPNKLYNITDIKTNNLYKGEKDFTDVYEGVDGNVYVTVEEEAENEDVIDIYKVDDGDLKKVTTLAKNGVYYAPVVYRNLKTNNQVLLGFAGSYASTEVEDGYKSYIYYITGKSYDLDDAHIVGDEALLSVSDSIITYSDKYVAVQKTNNKIGLLDFSTGDIKIDYNYDGLYTSFDGNYVAVKDKKAGVIDLDLKKVIDFEYDFIDRNDGFYIVSKDKKMDIIDENYKKVNKESFDYQDGGAGIEYTYKLCCSNINTFVGYKLGNKYVLLTNYGDLDEFVKGYVKHEAYVVSEDGTSQIIKEKDFEYNKDSGLIYSYFDKKITVYDSKMNKMYDIDLNKYDLNKIESVDLINGTLHVNKLLFDYKTGEQVKKELDYEKEYGNLTVKYSDGKVFFYENDEEINSYDYEFDESFYSNSVTELENGVYYNNYLKGVFVSILK